MPPKLKWEDSKINNSIKSIIKQLFFYWQI